jgi:O-antigen ligase
MILVNEQFLGRIETIGDAAKVQSTDLLFQNKNINRIDYWKASLQIFKDHPFGVGINNFHIIVPLYDARNPGLDAHNTFVLCYSEIGIIGILLFLFIILKDFLKLRHIKKLAVNTSSENEISLYVLALGTSLIAYIFGGMMTHSYLYLERTWMLLALPICLERAVIKLALEPIEKDSSKWGV